MDEEFRRPYEYSEEKRGFILLFVILLLVIDTLQTFSFTTQIYVAYKEIPIIKLLIVVLCILSILYMLYTAINSYKMTTNMVSIAKTYLILRVLYSVSCIIIIYLYTIKHKNLIGEGVEQYRTYGQMVVGELVVPIAYVLSFSIGWYLYFVLSKRVRMHGKAGGRHEGLLGNHKDKL